MELPPSRAKGRIFSGMARCWRAARISPTRVSSQKSPSSALKKVLKPIVSTPPSPSGTSQA
jgi:hypothetical protein